MKAHTFTTRALALTLTVLMGLMLPLAAQARYSTLEFGSRGSNVTKLQKALLELGFDPKGTDGKFGRGTESAVMAYQRSRGLTADGKAGDMTLTKLYGEAAQGGSSSGGSNAGGGSAGFTRTLRRGYTGTDVVSVQKRLKELGYYNGSVDGVYGSGCIVAAKAFQLRNGLKNDGLVGAGTYAKLFSSGAVAAAGGSQSGGSNAGNSGSSGGGSSTGSGSAGFTRTLRRGYTGSDVVSVQNRLKALGYYNGAIDGVYGRGCIAAAQAFQRRNALSVDGLVGRATHAKLFSSGAVAAGGSQSGSGDSGGASGSAGDNGGASATGTLRSGDTGAQVKRLQQALKNLKYNVTVDGTYGPMTVSAVYDFQRINGLSADGVAGDRTQTLLYSGKAKPYEPSSGTGSSGGSNATAQGPGGAKVRLMHWANEVKPLLRGKRSIEIYEPNSKITFTLHLFSLGRHCDVEPMTAEDTALMMKAWGGVVTWTPKFVYVKLPNGVWTAATMHNVAHGSQGIRDNNFDGQNCVHFLRDMDETMKNDPNYGVTNQKALRDAWKRLTGETIN